MWIAITARSTYSNSQLPWWPILHVFFINPSIERPNTLRKNRRLGTLTFAFLCLKCPFPRAFHACNSQRNPFIHCSIFHGTNTTWNYLLIALFIICHSPPTEIHSLESSLLVYVHSYSLSSLNRNIEDAQYCIINGTIINGNEKKRHEKAL